MIYIFRKLQESGGPWNRFSVINNNFDHKNPNDPDALSAKLGDLSQGIGSEYELDVQDSNEARSKREDLLSMFGYLKLSKEEVRKMLYMKENEIINSLNSHIEHFSSEVQPEDVRYFTYKDTTILSAVSSASKTIGGRILFRNVTGRFAWEFSYIQALSPQSIEPGKKTFDDINQKTLTIDSASLFDEEFLQKQKNLKDKLSSHSPQLKIEINPDGTEHKDVFKELFEYIREYVNDYVEVRNFIFY